MKYSFDAEPTRRRPSTPSTTPCSGRGASGTTAGRPWPSTGRRRGSATSTRTAGSSSTPTSTAPRPTTSPSEHPEKLQELINVWFAEAGKYDVLPLDDRTPARDPARRAAVADAEGKDLFVLYPDTTELPGAVGTEHPRPVVQDPRRGRDHRRRRPGRALRPRLPVRRSLALRQGPQALLRQQLHRRAAGAAVRRRRGHDRQARARHGVRQGVDRRPPRDPRHRPSSTSTTSSSPRVRCAPSRATSPCAARA